MLTGSLEVYGRKFRLLAPLAGCIHMFKEGFFCTCDKVQNLMNWPRHLSLSAIIDYDLSLWHFPDLFKCTLTL